MAYARLYTRLFICHTAVGTHTYTHTHARVSIESHLPIYQVGASAAGKLLTVEHPMVQILE